MAFPTTVLLSTEGTYPYFDGGVSTWCDALIRQMPDVQFTLLSLLAQPRARPAYQMPPNVIGCVPVPLWGTGGAGELRPEIGARRLHRMQKRLLNRASKREFEELFAMLLVGLLDEEGGNAQLGEALCRLAEFFVIHDYDGAFRHPIAWSVFRDQALRIAPLVSVQDVADPSISLLDGVEALRLLYRWLTPIALPMPAVSLVHASAAGLASVPAIVARLRYGTPFLLTEHGVYLRERYLAWAHVGLSPFARLFATRVIRRLVELSYAVADVVAPVSFWNSRWEQRLGAPPERIMPIANGVDPHRFVPQDGVRSDVPTMVWTGRIDPLKDLLTLIDATAIIREAISDVQVLLYGKAPQGNEGYEEACHARCCELGLEGTVRFMGYAAEVQNTYSQGHIVVLSSISESMPFSVIEAMFCGRPVVATNVAAVPELVGETGRIVSPRDPQALALACIELLRAPSICEELGRKARERALLHFTLQSSMDSYRLIYRKLTAERREAAAMGYLGNGGWMGDNIPVQKAVTRTA